MKATAIANSNIALTKYWGKRDKNLMLPNNGSVSMTLSDMFTKTTVEFQPDLQKDVLILNGQEFAGGRELEETSQFMDIVREMAGKKEYARIVSENNFPTAAGLASSASGYAALATAASKAAGLDLDKAQLSILARRGSGSASRSVEGGFVEWMRGEKEDGSDSYGVQIAPPDHWGFRMLTTIVTKEEKKVKSRVGMAQTVANCPYYKDWLATVNHDIETVKQGIKERDFDKVAKTAEMNALKMHATMITTDPPIIYWNPATMEIVHSVMAWREEGLKCYFTMDAGPNVKVMCMEEDVPELKKRLEELNGVQEVVICKPGESARLVDEHLF